MVLEIKSAPVLEGKVYKKWAESKESKRKVEVQESYRKIERFFSQIIYHVRIRKRLLYQKNIAL